MHLLYCCKRVWMENGGLVHWNATVICEMSKTSWQMGTHLMIGNLENHFNGPVIPFGSMVEYHPIAAKDQSRLHQCGKQVLPGIFLGYAWCAGGIWKEGILVAEIEELENSTRQRSMLEGSMHKKCSRRKRANILKFPIADGTAELFGRDHGIRKSTFNAGTTCKIGRSQGNSDKSRPVDETEDDAEARNDVLVNRRELHLSSSRGTSLSALCAEGRNIPDCI